MKKENKTISEEFVKRQIIMWLSCNGWGRNLRFGSLRDKGCDIAVQNNKYGVYFLIETKGESKIRQGQEVAFFYSLGQIITRMKVKKGRYKYGLGLPESSAKIAIRRIPYQIATKLRLHIFSVNKDDLLAEAESIKKEASKETSIKAQKSLDYLLSETISPSKSIVAPNLPIPGLETKESPSLIKTLSPTGASKSIRYISPSQLYNFADKLSIYNNYSKISKISQSNKKSFIKNIKIATGLNPNVRIKSKESFEGKIKRYNIAKKDTSTISDNLAGRIIVKNEDINNQLNNIINNFKIKEVKNYFENPTTFGY